MNHQEIKFSSAKKHQFLAGGGEMGKHMRTKDWSKTAVGDPDTWPQSLRTTISIILNSKFPMFLFWGTELVCFYNDAYRPSLGKEGKHPHILGSKGEDYWPEIWHIIKPLIDQVLEEGSATWSENQLIPIYRNGKIEDVYWTFSYSPVYDESGNPAGVFVTCVETTEAVITRLKLEESKDKLQFAIDATDLATWEMDPATYKFTGDERLREWHGFLTNEAFELETGLNTVIEKDRVSLKKAIDDTMLFSSNGILDQEYSIINRLTNQLRVVRAKGKVFFDENKLPKKITGTLQNITEQKLAEEEKQKASAVIEGSERSLRLMISQAPVAICILRGKEYVVEIANERMLELWGKSAEDTVDKPIFKGLPEASGQGLEPILQQVFETGETFTANERPVNLPRNGNIEITYINFTYQALKDLNGKINGILAVAIEVTDQVIVRQKIEASEKDFRQLADSLPELVWTTDANGKQTFASKRWKEFTGLDPRDENTFAAIVHPDDLENVIRVWTESLQTGKPYKTELRIKSKEGEYNWFYANGTPFKNENDEIEKWVGAFTNITYQKKAENDLKTAIQKIEESENRFQKIADHAPVLIRITGIDKLTSYFNKAWLQFRGRTMEQEINHGWKEGIHPDDMQNFLEVYNTAFDNRQEFYVEYRLKRFDGSYRWIYHKGTPRFTSDGNFEGYIGACMDIHEEIIYKENLEASEQKLNIVIEASEMGTWEQDLKTKQLTYSHRYLEILGYPKNIKQSHTELLSHLHPDDILIREIAFKSAVQTGSLYYQSRILWKDNSVHWIEAKGKVFFDELQQPLKMIGTIRDITDEKKYNQELEEREQKFRILADFMPQFVWTGDAQGNLNYFNQAVYNYSGLSPEKVESEGWLQIVHPTERDENIKAWIKAVTEGTDFIFEHRFKRYDGIYRWQLSRAVPQRDVNGNIQMWVGTSTDIQDIKEQEQQKDYFISMASHELKTPVTSIKGYVQILQSMYGNGADTFLQNSLKIVDKQILTLTKLISELLDISKIKSGGLDFDKEDFEINDLVHEIVSEIKHINPGYNIPVSATGKVMVNADRHRIGQVLINFLTNAVKYSPHADTIKVISYNQGNQVIISVEDTGIGISKKDQERIFERFYRVEGKNEKTFPGFGIGLFIASEIIKRHNGKINVMSEPGKGSVFSFSLPVNL